VIINMADRMKDAEDKMLESLFASEAIADNGFSARIEKRIRRGIWVRRMTLPVAVLVGGLISAKPLAGLLATLLRLVSVLPANVSGGLTSIAGISLPHTSTILLGVMVVAAFVMISRMLEEA
jgi:predicted transcriptional regulator with HTH domain